MNIEPFSVEIWMDEWETKCELNLAETCVDSLTIAQLLQHTGRNEQDLSALLSLKMTYGATKGSDKLRKAIAALYECQTPDNIVVTHGTIGANMLVHKTLVGRGDRVVCVVPTYQQHYSIPASIGADVHRLWLREEKGFLPDLEALRALVLPGTRLLALNNPNNPTGALIPKVMLEAIADIASAADAWLLCDEVYRGTDQQGTGTTVSVADIYAKGISTASMSKVYSLAGLRLGWIAAAKDLIASVSVHRDYDTISVGMVNDHFAVMALEHGERLLARSRTITRENLAILDNWVTKEALISWCKPESGTTALLKYALPMTSREFCVSLLQRTGVMLTPGAAFDMEGYVRIGYATSRRVLEAGLERVSEFLSRYN